MPTTAESCVQLAQTLLNHLGISVQVDGLPGQQTMGGISALPKEQRKALVNLTSAMNTCDSFLLLKTLKKIAINATTAESTPSAVSFLSLLIDMENTVYQGVVYVKSSASFKGIAQFNEKTWSALTSLPFSLAEDPKTALRAAVKLYKANRSFHTNHSTLPFTDDIAYLYHNQGASSALDYLKHGRLVYPKQSVAAVDLFSNINRGAKNETDIRA
jgi:hypothetical protein